MHFWPLGKHKKPGRISAARAKTAPAKSAPAKKQRDEGDRFGWRESARYVGAFLAVVALGVGAWAWWRYQPLSRLRSAVATHQHSRVDLAEIVFEQPVVGVEGVGQSLLDRAYAAARQNPYDRDALRAIAQAMIDSRWMEDATVRVTRDLTTERVDGQSRSVDRITIHGEFRHPFALIRRGESDYVVDGSGTRLPIEYKAAQVSALPAIINARGPLPDVGGIWRGGDITDGLLLIRYLRAQHREWYRQVCAIDVKNADGADRNQPRLELITDRGYRIAWGRAVGQEAGIEHPAAHKVQALDAYYLTRGHVIGSPQGTLYINQPLLTQDRQIRLTDAAEPLPGG